MDCSHRLGPCPTTTSIVSNDHYSSTVGLAFRRITGWTSEVVEDRWFNVSEESAQLVVVGRSRSLCCGCVHGALFRCWRRVWLVDASCLVQPLHSLRKGECKPETPNECPILGSEADSGLYWCMAGLR